MLLKDLIEQYGEYEVIDTVDTEIHKGNSKNEGINIYLRKPKPKSVWDLKYGDEYCYIDCNGDVYDTINVNSFDDEDIIKNGNAFLTKEEAERDAERREVETLLLKHGGRRWFKKDGENWALYLDKYNQATRFLAEEPHQGMIYFDKHGEAVKACEEIGNKRIVNALFEVIEECTK